VKSWGRRALIPAASTSRTTSRPTPAAAVRRDRENSRVQVFDEDGTYMDQWKNLHRPVRARRRRAPRRPVLPSASCPSHLPVNQACSEHRAARVAVLSMKGATLLERSLCGLVAWWRRSRASSWRRTAARSIRAGSLRGRGVSWTAVGKTRKSRPRETTVAEEVHENVTQGHAWTVTQDHADVTQDSRT